MIALVTDGRQVVAYLCDGKEVSAWFKGPVEDRSAKLGSRTGAELEAEFAEDVATGSVVLADGRELGFEAVPASGDAGLFRGQRGRYLVGWVVLPDGEQRGNFETGSAPRVSSAPPLSPKALSAGGGTASVASTSSQKPAPVAWGEVAGRSSAYSASVGESGYSTNVTSWCHAPRFTGPATGGQPCYKR
jgi:hypothetical protein